MARLRISAKSITLADTDQGGIRGVLTAHGAALNLFSQRERNEIVRDAFEYGGNHWIWKWLPLRFTAYARTIGYHVKAATDALKSKINGDARLPNVWSGRSRRNSLQAHADARATATTQTVTIRVPNQAPSVRATILTVPPKEIAAIAGAINAALVQGIEDHLGARMNPVSPHTDAVARSRAHHAARKAAKQGKPRRKAA
jgi:hypothetical protein